MSSIFIGSVYCVNNEHICVFNVVFINIPLSRHTVPPVTTNDDGCIKFKFFKNNIFGTPWSLIILDSCPPSYFILCVSAQIPVGNLFTLCTYYSRYLLTLESSFLVVYPLRSVIVTRELCILMSSPPFFSLFNNINYVRLKSLGLETHIYMYFIYKYYTYCFML